MRAECRGAQEALSAALSAVAGVVLDERPSEAVPDVAAAFAERVESAAVAGMLPPGWTRARDGLDVPTRDMTRAAGAAIRTPDQDLEAAEALRAIEAIVESQLTEGEATILTRVAAGQDIEQIAADLGISRGAVDTRLSRARRKIRESL